MGRNSSGGQRRSTTSSSANRTRSSSGRISGGRTRNTSNISRGGSSISSSSRRSTSGSPHRNSPPPPNNRHFHSNHHPHHNPRAFRHTPPPPRRSTTYTHSSGRYTGNRRSGGCLSYFIVIFVLFGILMVASFISNRNASKSTDEKHAEQNVNHPGSYQENVTQTQNKTTVPGAANYYSDQLGWISDQATLLTGLKEFEEKTGVKPFLYITDNVNGDSEPTEEELDTFTCELYDQLFTDENHFLLVFLEADDFYMTWYVCGNDAATIVDSSAAENVLDYIDLYYSNSSLTDEEYFSSAFSSAANSIMRNK